MKDIVKCNECKHHFLNGGDCSGTIIHSHGDNHDIIQLEFCSYGAKIEDEKEG